MTDPCNFSNFLIVSKNASLQHLYNVLEPIASQESLRFFEAVKQANFDDSLLAQNSVTLINVDRHRLKNKDFRMNERVFREQLASFKQEADPDVFSIGKKQVKIQDRKLAGEFKPKSEVVLKANTQRHFSATQLASSNYYRQQHSAMLALRDQVSRMQITPDFSGEVVTPL